MFCDLRCFPHFIFSSLQENITIRHARISFSFIYFYSKINFQNKYNHHSKNNVVIIRQLSGPSSKGKRTLQYQVGRVLPYKKKFPISSVGDIFLFQTSTSSHTFLALQGFYNSDQDLYKLAREIRENWILGRE